MEKKTRILIVDDEEVIRKNCSRIFDRAGYLAETADNGREALIKISSGDFDIVLADLVMPELDGISLLKEIVKYHPKVDVVLFTGFGTVDSAVEAMKIGAADYVPKPFTPPELLSRVDAVRRKREEEAGAEIPEEALGIETIIGASPRMQEVFQLIRKAAPTNSTVLITGESGTGKELIARAIHNLSRRRNEKFVAVDCSALPRELLESELFGHVKGSFTGAIDTKKGLFEVADKGTMFVDEVGDVSEALQGKFLRVLQEREFKPVGGTAGKTIDVRFIFATNKDLKALVAENRFREDLFYRIYVFPIPVPPLRERPEDISALASHFLKKYAPEPGRTVFTISSEAVELLRRYEWPGNVRQLENVIQRMVVLAESNVLTRKHLPGEIQQALREREHPAPTSVEELKVLKKKVKSELVEAIERRFVLNALEQNGWNVTRAAKSVQMQRTNFHALMRKLDIRHKKPESEEEKEG
jgi:DNA-binding NtrC family response regulator